MTREDGTRCRVSCILPGYNGDRFLHEAIDSILAQSNPPTEIVLVDDGSSDRTPEVARRYEAEITYLRQERSGPAAARNAGLGAATGEFIAFLDADDKWRSELLGAGACRGSGPVRRPSPLATDAGLHHGDDAGPG